VDARPRTSDGRLMAVVSRPVTAGKTNKGGLVRDVMLKAPFKIRDFQWNMDSWKEVRTCVFARPGELSTMFIHRNQTLHVHIHNKS